jgi:hypothetical protein
MPPRPHPMDNFIYHPAFCHLARAAAIQATIEASMRRDSDYDSDASRRQRGEHDESMARAPRRSLGQRLATLGTTLHLSLPRVNIRPAYAVVVSKAVTIITFAWRGRARRARLDPAVGALRNTGLFVRPHALRRHEDDACGGDSQLMPATLVITDPSHRQ